VQKIALLVNFTFPEAQERRPASSEAPIDLLPDRLSPVLPARPAGRIVLRLRLLGAMEARTTAGVSVLPRGRKSRALLALLAMSAPRPMLREQLCHLLWSRREHEQARASLRQCVHELQRALLPLGGELLRAERNHLVLDADRVWTDVHDLAPAAPEHPETGADLVACAGGRLLDDLVGLDPALDGWIEAERQRLRRTARAIAEAALAGELDTAGRVAGAERLLAIDPAHEAGWRGLMQAYAERGERAAVVEAFERCSAALAGAAGIGPSAETQALYARICEGPATPESLPRVDPDRRGVRLGVMPLRAIGGEDEALSLGLAEEITTALARFRWIFLIASVSLVPATQEAGDPSGRWRTLDLDFVLEGTVQRGGGHVRVSVRLLDLRAGGHVVWARRFDRPATDLLSLQDEMAAEIVAQVDPELLLHEGARVAGRPAADPSAYELLLQAIPAIYRLDQASFRAAGEALEAAVARDPSYAAAHAWLAYWHVFLVGQGWAEHPGQAMTRAGELADRAVTLDPEDARGLAILGHVRAFLDKRLEEAMVLHERALSLNPNLPLAWMFSGLTFSYAGHHEEGIRRIEHSRRLSPFDPHAFFFDMALMVPRLLRGEYVEVVEIGRRVTQLNSAFSASLKVYLSALGHLGWTTAADEVRDHLLRLEPGFTVAEAVARSPVSLTKDLALYAEGLRRAGLAQ